MTSQIRRSEFDRQQLIAAVGIAVLLFAFFRRWTYDDPYITYRYALNLAAGRGLVFNPGEHVLSTTSPLFALLLGGLHAFGAGIPLAANLVSSAAIAAGGFLLADIVRRLRAPAASWAALLLFSSSSLLVSTFGSETNLYLALSLAAADAYLRKRLGTAGFCMALAVLTRADALIFAALIAADYLLFELPAGKAFRAGLRRLPWRAVGVFFLTLLPWVLFGFWYYGSPLPATLAAKRYQALISPGNAFLPGLWRTLAAYGQYPHYALAGGLYLAGAVLAALRARRWLFLIAWPLVFAAAYSVLTVPPYAWYYASLVPGLVTAVALSLAELAQLRPALQFRPVRQAPSTGLFFLLSAAVVVFMAGAQLTDLVRLHSLFDNRYQVYRAIGTWLSENTPEDTLIGSLEIGIIGYFAAPRPMIDYAGLIRPDVAVHFGPDFAYQEAALWIAEAYHPDYLLITRGDYRALTAAYLDPFCTEAAAFPGDRYGYSKDLILFRCDRE